MSYPMYLQFKRTEISNEFIVDVLHSGNIDSGFKWHTHDPTLGELTVLRVIKTREPAPKTKSNPNNVNHNPKGVMWFQVRGVKL